MLLTTRAKRRGRIRVNRISEHRRTLPPYTPTYVPVPERWKHMQAQSRLAALSAHDLCRPWAGRSSVALPFAKDAGIEDFEENGLREREPKFIASGAHRGKAMAEHQLMFGLQENLFEVDHGTS